MPVSVELDEQTAAVVQELAANEQQGQRTLNSSAGKDLEKVVLIPTTTATSHRDTLAI
jgi:hypothetical protein